MTATQEWKTWRHRSTAYRGTTSFQLKCVQARLVAQSAKVFCSHRCIILAKMKVVMFVPTI